MRTRLIFAVLIGALFGSAVEGQSRREGMQPGRRQLEQRFRNRLRDVMQQRLGLTDEQVNRLADVNERFEARRTAIIVSEGATRRDLRLELAPGAKTNQDRVAELLDRALRTQRERLDLIEAEQRELATFLTPSQRAKYFGLQEQLRTQVEELRDRRAEVGGPRGVRRRPPPL